MWTRPTCRKPSGWWPTPCPLIRPRRHGPRRPPPTATPSGRGPPTSTATTAWSHRPSGPPAPAPAGAAFGAVTADFDSDNGVEPPPEPDPGPDLGAPGDVEAEPSLSFGQGEADDGPPAPAA